MNASSVHRLWVAVLSSLVLALPGSGAAGQDAARQAPSQQATGYVFHDQNENGQRDPGEPGVEGVAVSNGTAIATTDQQGRYQLPVAGSTTLFVVKPRDWETPVNENNLPQFYYVHKPDGSPDTLEYPGVEPTGPLPDEVNFPLVERAEPERFRVLVFGDTQPYSIQEVDYLAQDIVDELVGAEDVAFGLTMGDVVGDELDLFGPVNEAISYVGAPWRYLYGNHDMNFEAERDRLADETFERVYGPTTYAFVYGGVHFLMLDDVIYPVGDEGYEGGLREDQMTFVENYLARVPDSALVVTNMHIPLPDVRQPDRKRLLSLLEKHPHTLSMAAHTHTQHHQFMGDDEAARSDGPSGEEHAHQRGEHHHYVVGTTAGSWWTGMKEETGVPHTMMRDGTPNGYTFVTFDGNDYVIDYRVAGRPADYRMNIWTPTPVPQDTTASGRQLVVNVFNGNVNTRVAYRLDRTGYWTELDNVSRTDPYYSRLHRRWEHFETLGLMEQWENHPDLANAEGPGQPLPEPETSSHLWQAPLPENLSVGRHLIEVRVTDMFGRTFRDQHTFRVAP